MSTLVKSSHGREWSYYLMGDGGAVQVAVANSGDARADEERAFLIAAAPDLLAACERAADLVEEMYESLHGRGGMPSPTYVQLRAAIAAAKGQTGGGA